MVITELPPRAILHIDDSQGDLDLSREAVEECVGDSSDYIGIRDPIVAISMLAEYAKRDPPPPALIILDINMPRADGWEVLRFIRAQPALDSVPVIILSTSNNVLDIGRARAEGVEYRVKPNTFHALNELMREILQRRLS